MKKFFEKITGIEKRRKAKEDTLAEEARRQSQLAAEAEAAVEAARIETEKEEAAKKYTVASDPADAKTAATVKKEPWVAVLQTHVNPENPKNGFFELDWNEYFVLMLTTNGYSGKTEEEIVDQWFQDLCQEIGTSDGLPMDRRGSGYINVNNLGNGKSEVS